MFLSVLMSIAFMSCNKDEGINDDVESFTITQQDINNEREYGQTQIQGNQDPEEFFYQDLDDNDPDGELVELCATIIRTGSRICRNDLSSEAACDFSNVLNETNWYTDITINGSPYMQVCFPAKKEF